MSTAADQDTNAFLTKARTLRPIPALPASVPAPEVDYDFGALGGIRTKITVVGGGTVTFQSGPRVDPVTDAWGISAPFFTGLSAADKDAFLRWGYAVHARLVANVADFVRNMSRVQEVRDDLLTGVTE